MHMHTTVDPKEVAKFAQHSNNWWDINGPLKTLHDINPIRLEFIQKSINLQGQRVLDLGCGGGILAESLHYAGADVTGLDVEESAISAAKAHAQINNLPINYVCEPIESYDDEKFSIITCMEMLEHVSSPELIIHHAKRLLLPGGYLFLSTINRTPTAYVTAVVAAEYILNLLPRQTHDYKKFIKPSELAAMLRQESLSLIDLKGVNYNPFSRHAQLTPSVQINYLCACKL